MFGLIKTLFAKLGGRAIDAALPEDAAKVREAQSRINEQEIASAPPSKLRLWRPFLGWVLSLLFVWEVAGRLIIIPMIDPKYAENLPPSALETILRMLLGMLGLGF